MKISRLITTCVAAAAAAWLSPAFAQQMNNSLNESVEMLPLKGSGTRIETTIFKPDGAGPFPLVVISHPRYSGRPGEQPRYRPLPAARYFLQRGYAVLAPMQQGVSNSGGWYAGNGCDLQHNLRSQAEDVTGVLDHVGALPWADRSRILAVGHIHGGMTALAVAATNYPGIKGVLNFAGGWRHAECGTWQYELTRTLEAQAKSTQVPSLWFYGSNDTYMAEFARPMFDKYVAAGGKATLISFGPFQNDGSFMFVSDAGAPLWEPEVTKFLQTIGLPSEPVAQFARHGQTAALPERSGYADVTDVDKVPHIGFFNRRAYSRFLQFPMPRAYALSSGGAAGWGWGPNATDRAMEECTKIQKGQCRLYAIDDYVVWKP